MYHIKNDKRSQSSAEQIVRGLKECLKNTPLKAITVSDIHRITGISRATFYRLFDTPEDALYYYLDQLAEKLQENSPPTENFDGHKVLELVITQGMENHDILKAMVDNGRFDLLYQYTNQNFRTLARKYPIFSQLTEGIEREYVISQLSMNMVAILITWSQNGRKETPAEVVEYLRSYTQNFLTLLLKE